MFGLTLKKLRLIYGMNAKEFSKALGISASYLSEIENDKKIPSVEILQNYADLLDMKLSSVILLSEKSEDLRKKGKSQVFIQRMLLKWINHMSRGLTDENEEELST